jgi:hypothetical protein
VVKAFAIWLASAGILTLVAGLWIYSIYNDPRSGGEYIGVLAPIILWMAGMAVLVVIGLMAVIGAGATKVLQEGRPGLEDSSEEGQARDAAQPTAPARSSVCPGRTHNFSRALLVALAVATAAGLTAGASQWSQRDYTGRLEWHAVADPYLSSGRDDGGWYTYFILCDEGSARDRDNPELPAGGSAQGEVRHGQLLTEAERAVEAARYRCMESRPVTVRGPYFEDAAVALLVAVAVYFLIAAVVWISRALSRA